jgi:hypothetical protein
MERLFYRYLTVSPFFILQFQNLYAYFHNNPVMYLILVGLTRKKVWLLLCLE